MKLNDLTFDPAYHRDINPLWLKRITENFQPYLVNPPVVSERDGQYYIVDGLHTVKAYELVTGEHRIECKVYHGLTQRKEAELYYRLNTSSKHLSAADKMKARVTWEDDDLLRFIEATSNAGFTLDPKQEARWCIRAVRKAQECFYILGDRYEKMLDFIGSTWDGERWSVYADMLDGMTTFFDFYEPSKLRFVRTLGNADYWDITEKAWEYRYLPKSYRYAMAIGLFYNDGQKKLDLSLLR